MIRWIMLANFIEVLICTIYFAYSWKKYRNTFPVNLQNYYDFMITICNLPFMALGYFQGVLLPFIPCWYVFVLI